MVTNIRSVFNKMDELEARVREKAPDFVVLTESWLDNSIPDEAVALPRYAVIRKDRDRQGGGIILYVPADYPSFFLSFFSYGYFQFVYTLYFVQILFQ